MCVFGKKEEIEKKAEPKISLAHTFVGVDRYGIYSVGKEAGDRRRTNIAA